jgi:cbb3-type cytochrome oxidase subunit 3
MRRYAYGWLTLIFFLVSIGLHWLFGWYTYAEDAAEHGQQAQMSSYLMIMGRDTFENWQSEFLQLIWQVVGLAYFLYVGSPASKENDDRLEAKVDALLRINGGEPAEKLLKDLDRTFMRDDGHAQPHGHEEEIAKTAGRGIRHVALQSG